MRIDHSLELTPEIREKMKKNLVYVSIVSIVMIFAGLTSGYIVSMGDTFWVKYPLPMGFWISTGLIILSSIFYILAIKFGKTRQMTQVRLYMILTLLTGIGFAIFQFVGYNQLVDDGAQVRNSVMVVDGRYGDYFEFKYKNNFIEVDGNDYLIQGRPVNEAEKSALKSFVKPFLSMADQKGYTINTIHSDFSVYYKNEPLTIVNNQFVRPNGEALQYVDMKRLRDLSINILDDRGDFYHRGKIGQDFKIYYKGTELDYKNRTLMYGDKKLNAPLQNKINQSKDTASSYLYVITFLHLLHIFGALIYLIKMVKLSLSNNYTEANQLSLKLGSIFWHFLGLLWLFLLLFLLFIH